MTAHWQLPRWLRGAATDESLPDKYRHASTLLRITGPAPGHQPDQIRAERIRDAAEYISRLPGATCPTPSLADSGAVGLAYPAESYRCWFCEDGLAQQAVAHVQIDPPPDAPVLPTRPLACAMCLVSLANLVRLYAGVAEEARVIRRRKEAMEAPAA